MTGPLQKPRYDVVVVGGGHNGLTAAAYLARAGRSVLVLERLPQTGGAAVSAEVFPGMPPRLSRYSYLVGLMPARLIRELDLRLELRSRRVASYTPWRRDGVDGRGAGGPGVDLAELGVLADGRAVAHGVGPGHGGPAGRSLGSPVGPAGVRGRHECRTFPLETPPSTAPP